jgi:hypothetical protein
MRIKLRSGKKSNKPKQVKIPKKSIYALAVATVISMIWVAIGSFTKYGLQIKLSESYIPTLINGIATSTSLVIGIFIAILGIMLRVSIERKDSASKGFYLTGMIVLILPVAWLWSTYVFLTQGILTFAVTYALDAFISALFVLIVVVVYTVVRISNQSEYEDPTIGDDF